MADEETNHANFDHVISNRRFKANNPVMLFPEFLLDELDEIRDVIGY